MTEGGAYVLVSDSFLDEYVVGNEQVFWYNLLYGTPGETAPIARRNHG